MKSKVKLHIGDILKPKSQKEIDDSIDKLDYPEKLETLLRHYFKTKKICNSYELDSFMSSFCCTSNSKYHITIDNIDNNDPYYNILIRISVIFYKNEFDIRQDIYIAYTGTDFIIRNIDNNVIKKMNSILKYI